MHSSALKLGSSLSSNLNVCGLKNAKRWKRCINVQIDAFLFELVAVATVAGTARECIVEFCRRLYHRMQFIAPITEAMNDNARIWLIS